MTTTSKIKKTCAVCGRESEFEIAASTNTQGPSDLDLRPPPMTRNTLHLQMQECPGCGYCVADVATARDGMKALVKSEAYQKILKDKRPQLVNRYLAASFLAEKSGVLDAAGHLAVRAAWVADDAKASDLAKQCRLQAVALIDAQASDGSGHEEAMMTDLLRRAGELVRAKVMCDRGLSVTRDPIVRKVLQLQAKLIQAKDLEAHRMDEVA
jgi:hypothetical protein